MDTETTQPVISRLFPSTFSSWSRVIAVAAACSLGSSAQAELLDVYVGAGTWQQEFEGDVDSGATDVDVQNDLGLDDDDNIVAYVALEHGVPVLPNIRAQHFSIDVEGSNVLSRNITFNGQTFTLSDAVDTSIDLSQSDLVLYYEMLDSVVGLDVGLALSWIEGAIDVRSSTDIARAEFDEYLPMVYAKARVDLPMTGAWVAVEGQGLAYEDNSIIEYNAQVGWTSQFGLGLEAGWRSVEIELQEFDDVDTAVLEISGPYAAVNFEF